MNKTIQKMQKRKNQLVTLIVFYAAKIYACLFHKRSNIWLIAERGVDARDNAFVLYKYIKEFHPEIQCKYVITRDSFDINNIEEKDIIIKGSWDHYIAFVTSSILISTHTYGYSPDMRLFSQLDKYNIAKVKGKKIYLTHFLLDGREFNWNSKIRKIDLYTCSSEIDYKHILANSDYGKNVVKLLGTPRMDNLYKNSNMPVKDIILCMPTWRIDFPDMTREEFKRTEYFKNFNGLINDKRIIDYLQENNYKMIFYPHFEVQKFIGEFESKTDRIIIGDATKYVVENLLLECKMMITDYSSVHFDFALLRKKIIYFQFDQEKEFKDRPWGTHFLYDRDAFGPLFTKLDDLVTFVVREKNLEFNKEYEGRINRAFPIFDDHNCERVYNAILNLME